jgi:putative MATE family efflux protein
VIGEPRPARGGRARREQTAALGTRPVGRLLWQACSHTTMSVGTYGIYALTNAWFVSRGVGSVAFAAVNLVAPVVLMLGAVSTTVGVGGASLVSRSLGRGDLRQAARASGNAFLVYWTVAVAVTVLGLLLIDPLLTLLGATDATRGYARDYGLVILAGAITATGFSSLVRAEGRMRFSAMLWVLPVLTGIVLDPLLIFGLGLGVRGAALGTLGGQAVSMLMSLWFFFVQRDRPYRITLGDLRPDGATLRQMLAVGSPSFLSGFGATLLSVLANNLLVALGGPVVLSAFALCSRIGTFVMMPQLGIAQGLQPIAGYNAGRGDGERVRRAITLTMRATVLYGTAASLLLLVTAAPLVGLFTGEPAVRRSAAHALVILALGYPFAGVAPLVSAYFQALGRPRPSYLISIGTMLAVRVPMLLALSRFGTPGLLISFPLAELVTAGVAVVVRRRQPLSRRRAPLPDTGRPPGSPRTGNADR